MGLGLVIILHLIAITIAGGIIACISAFITYLSSKKASRKRNVLTSVFLPFAGLYTLYICGLAGLCIISSVKNIDIGFGDVRYIPLPDNCQLLFIDNPDQAFIKKNEQTVISEVSQLQQTHNRILGKTVNNKYFSYNTATNELKEFESKNELLLHNADNTLNLKSAVAFYSDKRNDIVGASFIIVGVASLLISMIAIYLTRKLIVRWSFRHPEDVE